jgi:hypothetical protein
MSNDHHTVIKLHYLVIVVPEESHAEFIKDQPANIKEFIQEDVLKMVNKTIKLTLISRGIKLRNMPMIQSVATMLIRKP